MKWQHFSVSHEVLSAQGWSCQHFWVCLLFSYIAITLKVTINERTCSRAMDNIDIIFRCHLWGTSCWKWQSEEQRQYWWRHYCMVRQGDVWAWVHHGGWPARGQVSPGCVEWQCPGGTITKCRKIQINGRILLVIWPSHEGLKMFSNWRSCELHYCSLHLTKQISTSIKVSGQVRCNFTLSMWPSKY